MKAGARSYWTLAASLAIFAVLVLVALGIKQARADETTGLDYLGPMPTVVPPPPRPQASDEVRKAAWFAESLAHYGEPPINQLVSGPDAEAYRFSYEPTFDPNVCVTVWREGDRYQMRTVVLYGRSTPILCGKTVTIPARKWNRLRSAFTKHSVTDPYDGTDPNGGIDGSTWSMESLVAGRTTLTRVSNPVRSLGPRHFQIVRPREPRVSDFVKTSFLFLDWAGVRVPEMY